MYSVFLSSYTNTRESLGELEKAVETLAPTAFLVLLSGNQTPSLPGRRAGGCLSFDLTGTLHKGTQKWPIMELHSQTHKAKITHC